MAGEGTDFFVDARSDRLWQGAQACTKGLMQTDIGAEIADNRRKHADRNQVHIPAIFETEKGKGSQSSDTAAMVEQDDSNVAQ